MGKSTADTEEVSIAEAAKRLAMTQQGIGQWADKAPSDCAVLRKGRRWLIWPHFPVWYRQQLQKNSTPADLEEARKRKMSAEAELAELELQKARGELLTVQQYRDEVARLLDIVFPRLQAVTARLAPQVVGVTTVAEAQGIIDPVIREILRELSEAGEG
jgi:hypothetical protein